MSKTIIKWDYKHHPNTIEVSFEDGPANNVIDGKTFVVEREESTGLWRETGQIVSINGGDTPG